ncbi:MAG: nucleotidyl transferase AbiEii/AbiGii toxin family protein [Fibrobacterota bacterium]
MTNNLETADLGTIAIALGDLNKDVIFVGGLVCQFYAQAKATPAFRPTDDIDCVIEIHTHKEYAALEKQLRSLGFSHDTSPGAPICRKVFRNIKVDFMPSGEKVIGFTNKWFQEGVKHTLEIELPGKTRIRILELPYFLATKFEALFDRGRGNLYSHDFEDIVNVLAYRISYEDLETVPIRLKKAFRSWAETIMNERGILETVKGHLPSYESIQLAEKIHSVFQKMSVSG